MNKNTVFWIDVRDPNEYADDHLEGAINIPYAEIAEKIHDVTENIGAEICLYCGTGKRSEIARENLNSLGYENVKNMGSLQDALALRNK